MRGCSSRTRGGNNRIISGVFKTNRPLHHWSGSRVCSSMRTGKGPNPEMVHKDHNTQNWKRVVVHALSIRYGKCKSPAVRFVWIVSEYALINVQIPDCDAFARIEIVTIAKQQNAKVACFETPQWTRVRNHQCKCSSKTDQHMSHLLCEKSQTR